MVVLFNFQLRHTLAIVIIYIECLVDLTLNKTLILVYLTESFCCGSTQKFQMEADG